MSKNQYSRSAPTSKNFSLLAGILIGMALGLVIAAGIAWYILETPSSFDNNVPHETTKLKPDTPSPPDTTGAAAPENTPDDGKPRFEFYKVLTDKQDGAAAPAPSAQGSKPAERPAAAASYYLQTGAFSNAGEAEKLKARLAMLGMEALIQDANVSGKIIHRVRLGPYSNEDEMKEMQATLKQNGIESTPTRAQ